MQARTLDYATPNGPSRRKVRWVIAIALVIGVAVAMIWPRRAAPYLARPQQQLMDRVYNDLDTIRTAVLCIEADTGSFPSERDGLGALCRPTWRGPCLKQVPRDPWGHAYVYHKTGTPNAPDFAVLCLGEDGIEGTRDDLRPMTYSCAVGMLSGVESRRLQRDSAWRLQAQIQGDLRDEFPWCPEWGQRLMEYHVKRLTEVLERAADEDSAVVAAGGNTSSE